MSTNVNELLTKEDLIRHEERIRQIIEEALRPITFKKALTSSEVMDLLRCSEDKLSRLRRKELDKAKKLDGTWLYNAQQVYDLLPE